MRSKKHVWVAMVTNFFDGLLDSDLVVDGHHRHQRSFRANGGLQQLNTHKQTLAEHTQCLLYVLCTFLMSSLCCVSSLCALHVYLQF